MQALVDERDQLDALRSIAIPQHALPGMAEAGVRLQAARRAAQAAVLDAEVALAAAQVELIEATGGATQDWLWPSTPPQAGRYAVSQRAGSEASVRAQRAGRMALEYDKLQHRADAVIQADVHRAELVRQARRRETAAADDQMTALDCVVRAVLRQNQQTLGFLDDLTEYNMAIANYVLATAPANLSAEELAGKLAIRRNTLRDS